ncbi:MAG: FAD-dependent oxidoreductase [Spongiibacter sp.]|uniref:FAD-dependent oxidoreductase n=1 Tax=Spongiibacter thalassae TaxID=2721624 RepID=A0ABX1GK27_9GAMM|nr:FAD-dependent oxidoreductase [Spongiibacter thalassae]MDX1505558.1 FAD-dependent oxidoreductase [Spongiibacter sp.]NKI19607.1 FAD-dependent oxidoreductase [Spongiibacter thalassae]
MSRQVNTEVAVIGGGVQGAGIAQAAAAAGYKVCIFERDQWASGTSRRSSKLIHGGLRYLETGQFSLVYHSLRERAQLLRNAPELVRPVRFYIPIYRDTGRRPWQIRAGLTLYFFLSGCGPLGRFRKVPKAEWQGLDGLNTEGLQAVFQYWDGQTDDQLLTEAVVRSAQALGAETFTNTELIKGRKTEQGYRLELRDAEGVFHCDCRSVVNATGPWVNDTAKRIDGTRFTEQIELVRGSHILVDKALTKGVFYMEAPEDGRAVFAMPWGEHSLVGTTEMLHEEGPDSVLPTEKEIVYLQNTLAHYFPGEQPVLLNAWAGLRVLPKSSASANKRLRDTFLLCDDDSQPAAVSVYGGKLTAYRHTAERVVAQLVARLGKRSGALDTRKLKLEGALPSATRGASETRM